MKAKDIINILELLEEVELSLDEYLELVTDTEDLDEMDY